MAKPLFDFGLSRETKQIAVIALVGLAVLAVYEFSSNAGTEAGSGIGTGAIIVGGGAAAALIIFAL
jgi:hypothetical protein